MQIFQNMDILGRTAQVAVQHVPTLKRKYQLVNEASRLQALVAVGGTSTESVAELTAALHRTMSRIQAINRKIQRENITVRFV